MFSDSLLPLANGVSVSVDTLTQALRDQGHYVELYGPRFPGHIDAPEAATVRFDSIRLPWADRYPIAIPPAFPFLPRFRRGNFDVVHTHTLGISGYIGLKWAKAHDLPLVATYHTLYDRYAHYCTILPRRYVRYKIAAHTKDFFNSAQAVLTPSRYSKRWLERHKIKTPIEILPTAIRPARPVDREKARLQLGISPEAKVLLTVGRVVNEKHLDCLLRSCVTALKQLGADALFLIVGDGPYREELARKANASGIAHQIRFTGHVPPDSLSSYYSAADLFVFASTTETQGLVVQEAMAYGLPAALIIGGGASSAIENGVTGFAAANSPDALAATIVQAFSDPIRLASIGEAARERVSAYTPSDMASRVAEIYESVLTQRPQESVYLR